MNNINFVNLLKKSIEIIKKDLKRLGIIWGIGSAMSFLVVKERINPISTTVYLMLTFAFFLALWIALAELTKENYIEVPYSADNILLGTIEKSFLKSLKIQLIYFLFVILILILASIPIALLIVFIGQVLTKVMPLFYLWSAIIVAIPVIALNIAIGNAFNFGFLNSDGIVQAFKNSIFLWKIDKKLSVVITVKLYAFYYGIVFFALLIRRWVSPLSAILITTGFMFYGILNTLIFFELIKGNEELFDEENRELWEE